MTKNESTFKNSVSHWALFVLANNGQTEPDGYTINDIRQKRDFLHETNLSQYCLKLVEEGYLKRQKRTDRPYNPYSYYITEKGLGKLNASGAPTRRPPKGKLGSQIEGMPVDVELPEIKQYSLEPNWHWLGQQLQKLGRDELARDAFNKDLTPRDVYGDGGVLDLLYDGNIM